MRNNFLGLNQSLFRSIVNSNITTHYEIYNQDNVNQEEGNEDVNPPDSKGEDGNQQDNLVEPKQLEVDDHMDANNEKPTSSNFLSYFFVMTLVAVCAYLIFHNKKKVNLPKGSSQYFIRLMQYSCKKICHTLRVPTLR